MVVYDAARHTINKVTCSPNFLSLLVEEFSTALSTWLAVRPSCLLIELCRQNPCLWNVKADVYKDRNKRVAAINNKSAELQKSGLFANASEVKKKIESIRSQYRRELRKLEKSKSSGAGADEVYTPDIMAF